MRIPLIAILLVLFFIGLAYAHDGYEGLHNAAGFGCCGGKDCGPTETRLGDHGQLQAHIVREAWQNSYWSAPAIDGWFDVPPEVILPAELNPIAGPSACWTGRIVCFMPGRED